MIVQPKPHPQGVYDPRPELRAFASELAGMAGHYAEMIQRACEVGDDGLCAYATRAFAAHAKALVETANDLIKARKRVEEGE